MNTMNTWHLMQKSINLMKDRKREKIPPKLIHTVQSYINKHGGQYITVNDIIKFFKVYHKDLWSISEITIRRILKNHLERATEKQKREVSKLQVIIIQKEF